MSNSRNKGAVGERQIAADYQAATGIRCERMGRNGRTAEDLDHDTPGVHLEAKRPAKAAVWKYVDQATKDAPPGSVPVVLVRADRRETLLVVRLADIMTLAKRLAAAHGTPIYPSIEAK